MQRRDSRKNTAGLDHGPHIAEEECEQQSTDMSAVHIGIGHEDDLAVAGRLDVKSTPGARSHHLDDRRALDIAQHVRL